MNTHRTEPSHDLCKPMAMGRQLEQKRLRQQRAEIKALESRYEAAIRAMVAQASVPEGHRKLTWTVNEGVVYVGVQKLRRLEERRGSGRCRDKPASASGRRDIELPAGSFTWVEVGPLPDLRAVARGDADVAFSSQPQGAEA